MAFAGVERLRGNEVISIAQRREKLCKLLNLLERESEVSDEMVELTMWLLGNDPLSDQQSGVVARAVRDSLKFITLEMMQIVVEGDWQNIRELFEGDANLAVVWEESMGLEETGEGTKRVYREMRLENAEARKIKELGVVPKGIVHAGDLRELIIQQLKWKLGKDKRLWSLMELPLCKSNVLRQVWEIDPEGWDSPWKLGTSTTTFENLKKPEGKTRMRFGEVLIIAEVKKKRLVREKRLRHPDDERTVLFGIKPEEILGVYDAKGLDEDEVWKLDSDNVIERMLYRRGRKLL